MSRLHITFPDWSDLDAERRVLTSMVGQWVRVVTDKSIEHGFLDAIVDDAIRLRARRTADYRHSDLVHIEIDTILEVKFL